MATEQRRVDIGARTFAATSVIAVVFGIVAVLIGDTALAGAGVLAVIVGAVALLLAVGRYIGA